MHPSRPYILVTFAHSRMPDSTIVRSQCSVAYMRSGLMHVKTPGDVLIALDLVILRHCAASMRRAHEVRVVRVEALDGASFMLVMKCLAPEERGVLMLDARPPGSHVVSIPRTVVRLQRGWRRALEAVRGRRLAVAMALHPRLGGGWLSALDEALVRHIAVEHRILGS